MWEKDFLNGLNSEVEICKECYEGTQERQLTHTGWLPVRGFL